MRPLNGREISCGGISRPRHARRLAKPFAAIADALGIIFRERGFAITTDLDPVTMTLQFTISPCPYKLGS